MVEITVYEPIVRFGGEPTRGTCLVQFNMVGLVLRLEFGAWAGPPAWASPPARTRKASLHAS